MACPFLQAVTALAGIGWDGQECNTLWQLYEAARAEEEKAKARWAGPAEVTKRTTPIKHRNGFVNAAVPGGALRGGEGQSTLGQQSYINLNLSELQNCIFRGSCTRRRSPRKKRPRRAGPAGPMYAVGHLVDLWMKHFWLDGSASVGSIMSPSRILLLTTGQQHPMGFERLQMCIPAYDRVPSQPSRWAARAAAAALAPWRWVCCRGC